MNEKPKDNHPHPPAPTVPSGPAGGPKEPAKRSGIRTMVTDAQEYLKGGKVSLAQLLGQKKEEKKDIYQKSRESRLKIIIFAGAVVLILSMLAGGAFWLRRIVQGPVSESLSIPKSLVPASATETIKLEIPNRNDFLQAWILLLKKRLLPREFIYVPIFDKDKSIFLESKGFFSLLNITPPSSLLSTLQQSMTLGIMDTPRGNEPILVFKIREFSEAFAGMLAWENNLPRALKDILSPDIILDRGDNIFQDMVILNHDSRLLKNKDGETVFVYTIFNQRFLILSQSEITLETTLRQLSFFPPQ